MRWLFVLLGAAILAAVGAVIVVLPDDEPVRTATRTARPTPSETERTPSVPGFTDPCGTFDTGEKAPYAVTGYWVTPRSNPCTWRRQFQEIHQVGGDTVIRIGYGLQYRTVDDDGFVQAKDGTVDARYEDCVEDGLSCHAAAVRDLEAANPDNRIGRTYVYRTDESFGPGLFRCAPMERTIRGGKHLYFRVLAPMDGSDDPTCDFSRARTYDLILIAGAPEDSLTELLDLGDRFGVRVFPALPLAPRDPKVQIRANPEHLGTLTTLTRRILQDYGARFADRGSLGGVYQPFEVQMSESLTDEHPTLQVYADQHKIVQQELPEKPILISPYLDARKRVAFGQTPAQVAAAFKALTRTGVGIIAPQDSRGTGKVGLFWPDQRDEEVDERLRSIVGETTYGIAYHGSTRDYYREMATAREEMLEAGFNVQLWANVEAFEPSGDKPCAPQGTRGKTDKKRLDQAVTMAGRYVQKIVSYMWSDYMTCGTPSLESELKKDWQRPIAVDAIRRARAPQDGVEVRGYNLKDGTVSIEWSGGSREIVVAEAGWLDLDPLEELPEHMVTAWVPFDWTLVPAGEWVRIRVRTAAGQETTEPLHVRIAA
ncbi:DUF4434 domain-containing protein [Nonomuraea sp. NPDC023979]|uniref:DUF4434 domain-containing protein n=1 Tax=Nonomuraea sp. NPDC023979 TaxID=3154796 RepID=UPI0033FE1B83